ncbi:LOW QUALITY PROTEIN: hypothetical protein PanWU01x14_073820 [Parasponia andersonii]|uniref:Uncharacterized protein n=1 Tax=Parasponia andersonii TaxID=3476 RepID=A0A2P5DD76_PARAD|nr:LOW QUALITY PROTEIN: hypothetical protein PanWU01x14_073820 [Parasponia andersonii]
MVLRRKELRQLFDDFSTVVRCHFNGYPIALLFDVENGCISMVLRQNFDYISIDNISTKFRQYFKRPFHGVSKASR